VLDKEMSSDRYRLLLERLLDAALQPRLGRRAAEPAAAVLPGLVGKPWQRFAFGGHGAVGAGQLDVDGADETWHAVRINGKRARYAAEAISQAMGGEVAELAKALAAVQDLLGAHQDAAVAAETWLAIANADPDDYGLAVTAGRLYERERAFVREAREAFPEAWKAASKRRLTQWLH
jgi:CHAD domain-containing protein